MHEAPKRYILNDESLTRFENALEYLKNVEGHTASNEIEALLYKIQSSFKSAANSTLRTKILNIKKPTQKQTNKQKKNQKWFTRECCLRRRELKTICKGLSRVHNNPFLRGRFFKAKKAYKRTFKQAKRKQEQILLSNLESLEEKNPKGFWKVLKQIKGGDKKEVDTPSSEEFLHHYKNLLQSHSEPVNGEVKSCIPNFALENLNRPIDTEEIQEAINKLKNGKAPGIDNINSELIKAAKGTLLLEIKELFNKILDSAHYPEIWNHGLIYSIYKNGDTKDLVVWENSLVLFYTRELNINSNHMTYLLRNKVGFVKNTEPRTKYIF